jgi:hypothetical protein
MWRSEYIVTNRGVCVTYKTGFGLDDWICCTVYSTTCNTALSLIYPLYNSPLLTHLYSQSSLAVSWQRIYKRLTITSNHTWSFPFLALILRLPIPKTRLQSIPLLPSSYPGRLASRNSTLHFPTRLLFYRLGPVFWLCPFINPRHGPHRQHSLYY